MSAKFSGGCEGPRDARQVAILDSPAPQVVVAFMHWGSATPPQRCAPGDHAAQRFLSRAWAQLEQIGPATLPITIRPRAPGAIPARVGGGPRSDVPQAAREAAEAGAPSVEPPGAVGYVRSAEPLTRVNELVALRFHIAMPMVAPRAGAPKRRKGAKASTTSEPFGEVTNLCDIKLSDLEWAPALPAGATLCKACANRRGRAASALHG